MKPVNGRLLRPLLERSRAEIEAYIEAHRLGFRLDSSNESLDYTRNKIRHRVIPACKEINPSFLRAARETCCALEETEKIFLHGVEQLKKEIVVEENGELLVHVDRLMASPAPFTLLFEILRPYGFNAARVEDVLRSSTAIPGKQFFSGEYLLTRDRTCWRLFKATATADPRATLDGSGEYRVGERLFHLREREVDGDFRLPTERDTACLDLDKLAYPLVARRWREGDRFRPLGMKWGHKQLSDFFVDQKFSARQKRDCLVLQSGDDIVWVVGHRPDDRYKITPATRRALVITVSGV
jgi:tRNA(Ile)-lysidine synthase